MGRVVLDTDVASLSFKRELPPALLRKLAGLEPSITFITQGELTKWAERRHWGTRRRARIAQWLDHVPVIHSADVVTRVWGELAAVGDFDDFVQYDGLNVITV